MNMTENTTAQAKATHQVNVTIIDGGLLHSDC